MKKNALRKLYAQKRHLLSDSDVQTLSFRIAQNFLASRLFPTSGTVHFFLSIAAKKEVLTHFIYEQLWKQYPELVTVASKANFDTLSLSHHAFTLEMDLVTSHYGIPEPIGDPTVPPSDIDTVLVPLYACDKSGFRVGYGKGFYDRFLAQCRPETNFVGLSFFPPIDTIEDKNEYDVPLTHCVTPTKVFAF